MNKRDCCRSYASRFVQLKALGVFPGSLHVPGSTACSAQHSRGALFDLLPGIQLVLWPKQNSRHQSSFPTQVGGINHRLSGQGLHSGNLFLDQ